MIINRSRTLVFFYVFSILVAGCEKHSKVDQNAVLSDTKTNFITGVNTLHLERIAAYPLSLIGSETELFIGDVHGNKEPEIIVADNSSIMICDYRGREITEKFFDLKALDPAVLYDYDGDKKLDIICGSYSSDNLAVTIINGCGHVIQSIQSEIGESVYSSIHPQYISDNVLYAIVHAMWADSPRGIVALNLPDSSIKWTFFLPSKPIKLTRQEESDHKEIITISHTTGHTGRFLSLGTGEDRLKPGDNSIRLFQTNPEGEIVNDREPIFGPNHLFYSSPAVALSDSQLKKPTTPLSGRGEFFPLGQNRNEPLLLVQTIFEDHPAAPFFNLHVIKQPEGYISSTTGPYKGTFSDLCLQSDIVILWKPKEGPYRIDVFNQELQHKRGKKFFGETACLGPVLSATNDDFLFFVSDGNRLLLLDSELEKLGMWETEPLRKLRLFTVEGTNYLAGLGKNLVIWKVK